MIGDLGETVANVATDDGEADDDLAVNNTNWVETQDIRWVCVTRQLLMSPAELPVSDISSLSVNLSAGINLSLGDVNIT